MSKPIDEEIFKIATEIEQAVAEGKVLAIAAVMVMPDGAICTKIRYTDGHKFPLLAGSTLLNSAVLRLASQDKEELRGPA